jgi:hypothetical protein
MLAMDFVLNVIYIVNRLNPTRKFAAKFMGTMQDGRLKFVNSHGDVSLVSMSDIEYYRRVD